MSSYDAIVIGVGHNGLTNPCVPLERRQEIRVVEKDDYVGGATVNRELCEGWKDSDCSYVCSPSHPEIQPRGRLHAPIRLQTGV